MFPIQSRMDFWNADVSHDSDGKNCEKPMRHEIRGSRSDYYISNKDKVSTIQIDAFVLMTINILIGLVSAICIPSKNSCRYSLPDLRTHNAVQSDYEPVIRNIIETLVQMVSGIKKHTIPMSYVLAD